MELLQLSELRKVKTTMQGSSAPTYATSRSNAIPINR